MDANTQKEEFSYAYVYSVVAAAGYSFSQSSRSVDLGGIDATIYSSVTNPTLYTPQIDLQIKSTSRELIGDNEVLRYPLKLKNYNELRKEKTLTSRILILVLLPDRLEEWIQQSKTELCLRHCAYWMSLRGMPATKNVNNVTIYIPREQLFTPTALKTLMQRIETRGTL